MTDQHVGKWTCELFICHVTKSIHCLIAVYWACKENHALLDKFISMISKKILLRGIFTHHFSASGPDCGCSQWSPSLTSDGDAFWTSCAWLTSMPQLRGVLKNCFNLSSLNLIIFYATRKIKVLMSALGSDWMQGYEGSHLSFTQKGLKFFIKKTNS